MKLLNVDNIDSALQKLLQMTADFHIQTERLPLVSALGKTLASDVSASGDIPGFDRSAVDGYAVVASDTAAAGESMPVFLEVVETVKMGKPAFSSVKSGTCAYVPTGGMLPAGADAMVMVEYCEQFDATHIAVGISVSPGRHVVYRGEDVRAGEILLKRGKKLRPHDIGALAAAGITEIEVFSPLSIAIISTGDELVPPEKFPENGQVRDINTYALSARAIESGFTVTETSVVRDDYDALCKAAAAAMKKSDIVVISGGSSQGEKDMTEKVIAEISSPGVFVHGLAIKPGKPTIIGTDSKNRAVLVGLPGHPVSALTVFDILLVRYLETRMESDPKIALPATISRNVASAAGRTTCQPVSLRQNGPYIEADPVFGKSGLITTLTQADGYVILDRNVEGIEKGDTVYVHLY